MKFIDEFRDPKAVKYISEKIHKITSRQWKIMEVCGGQTHSILRYGLDELLPAQITLLHGPGCPVCVTSEEVMDHALAIAGQEDVVFTTFGDMLRVPGSDGKDLTNVRAHGSDVRIVYSPLDAVNIAIQELDKQIVFLAVGFETTAPANALAVKKAYDLGLKNFSILTSHVLVPPALESLLKRPHNDIQGFLAAGHVCTVMGYTEYEPISAKFEIPIVVTGFEPLDILEGIYFCVRQLEEGRFEVENQYSRSVIRSGNERAQDLVREIFSIVPQTWRGLGAMPDSGLAIKEKYLNYDAKKKYSNLLKKSQRESLCPSGKILTGEMKPNECKFFGKECTPNHPLGVTMVSGEGACGAYFKYRNENAMSHS